MSDLSEQFISEARDLIAQATDELIAIERDGATVERIDRLLRAFHTLKGSAGLVEIPAMTLAMHAAEDLVGAIQTHRVKADAAVIDQALACLDLVTRWVDAFDANGELPPGAGDEARRMADQLRGHIAPTAGTRAGPASGMLPAWASALLDGHTGGPMSMEARVQSRAHIAYAMGLARQAVDTLFYASGASSIQTHVPIQRFQRDVQALANHAIMHTQTALEIYGRVLCGLPPNTPIY